MDSSVLKGRIVHAVGGLLTIAAFAGTMLTLGAGTADATGLSTVPASAAVTVQYTLPNTPSAAITSVTLTASTAATFFNVQASSVPGWLNVTKTGTAGTGVASSLGATLSFQANSTASAMLPGTYTAVVTFQSSLTQTSAATAQVAVTLFVNAAPASFTAITSSANNSWNQSLGSVVVPIVCSSNGGPIAFAVAVGGQMGSNMTPSITSGIAYSWGSTVNVTIPISYLLPITIGTPLSGTVTLTPTNGAPPVVITINVNINLPNPNITSYSIGELPVDLTTDHTVVVNGTGFQTGTTQVQVKVTGGAYAPLDANHVNITSTISMIVTLDHAAYLAATHAQVFIQASNATPASWYPTTALTTLSVVSTPIIYAITNAASFAEPATGTNPTVAPYEIISIFGANFDGAAGQANNTSYATAPGIFSTNPNNYKGAEVLVLFCKGNTLKTNCLPSGVAGSDGTDQLAEAPVIFVSNNQINAVVPNEIAASLGTNSSTLGANVLVSIGTPSATSVNDAANQFLLNTSASVPAIFTPGGSGRGAGAVLNVDYTLNTAANPDNKATVGNALQIYATGLGVTTSTGVDTAVISTGFVPATSCMSETNYLALLAGATTGPASAYGTTALGTAIPGSSVGIVTLDGALIASANLWSGVFPPCFTPSGTGYQVQLGTGALITPTYVGMVPDSIAGLYQINVPIPSAYVYVPAIVGTSGGPIALTILFNGVAVSQPGVVVYVK